MIKIDHLSYSYTRRGPLVLSDFSLCLHEGGVYGLLGSNGAGKTTLLALIAGLLTPAAGTIDIDGHNPRLRLPHTMAEIFIVPEEINLPPVTLARYAELYGAMYPRFSADDMHRHLATFELDASLRLDRMSMGQRKKAFLCFAMACNTRVLLMDEPTNGLDIPSKAAFRRFVAGSITDDRIFIISTHQVRDVDRLLDHILIMNNSSVLLDSSVAQILERLSFVDSHDPQLISSALHAIPGIGGASLILPASSRADTDINLETLFDFAVTKPQLLNSIFSDNEK